MKDRTLVISFSGGLTSAYMAALLFKVLGVYRVLCFGKSGKPEMIKNYTEDGREVIVLFANSGVERKETLKFIHQCDEHFKFNTVWIEAVTNPIRGKGCDFKVVNYHTASRNGEPFELLIKKEGIPNQNFPHCSERLKRFPMQKYLKHRLIKNYDMALGIRADEPKRLKAKPNIYYPLSKDYPTTKKMINKWWLTQPFTLALKGYEGNCTLCWKKSRRKLLTILVENPELANWWNRMEVEYGKGYTFYRDEYSMEELIEESKRPFIKATEDFTLAQLMHSEPELDFTNGCEESCEAF